MRRYLPRVFIGALAATAWFAACAPLPPTEPLVSAGRAGASGGSSGGSQGGTAGSGAGGASAGGAGTGTGGATGGSSGSAPNGGTSGSGTSGTSGTGDGGAEDGGADSGGSSGSGGSGGSSGKGGSAGSAGSSGSGGRTYSTDPETFFGDSRCTSDLDFCEDFEGSTLGADRWRIQTSGDEPALETVRAARGTRSVHFHTVDNGLSLIHTTEPFPAASNRYYGRLFVWFDSMPTAPEWAHWTIAASGSNSDETEVRVGGQYDNTINRFGVGTDRGPTGDWTILDEDPGDPVPVRTWVCVEWLHDAENDVTDLWWNGVLRPSLHTTATENGSSTTAEYLIPEIDTMFVGFWLYQTGTVPEEFDVWIDELAIDSERIGCNN
jgi:hypothetical protein